MLKNIFCNYFLDFRGRNYPEGTFNFMSVVRNFISFSDIKKLSIENVPSDKAPEIFQLLTIKFYPI